MKKNIITDFLEWRREKKLIQIVRELELEEKEKTMLSSLDKAILDKMSIFAYNRVCKELIEWNVTDEWVRGFLQWNKFFKSFFRKYNILENNKK